MGLLFRINGYLRRVEEFILSYSIVIMALILIGNVIARTIFQHSWRFAEEVGQFLVVMITFVGTSYAARVGRHICMTALFDAVPFKIKKLFLCITSSFSTCALLYLTHLGIRYVLRVYASGRITPALGVPIWIIFAFVPIGFCLTGLQYLFNLILNVRDKNNIYLGTEVNMVNSTNNNCTISSS